MMVKIIPKRRIGSLFLLDLLNIGSFLKPYNGI